jgi:HPt (histidine-containing phosphotransfer) domain-containing protein
MSDAEVLDQPTVDALLESVGGDNEFLAELIDTFVEDAPNLFAAMREGIQSGESEPVQRAAHTLKSTAASLGALPLSETARAIETQARDGDLSVDVDSVEQQFQAAKDAFAALTAGQQ